MKIFERYFERNPVDGALDFSNNPEAVVIIPVLNDCDIFATIDSLCRCSCEAGNVGIVILVNHSENCDQDVKTANADLADEIQVYIEEKDRIYPSLEFRLVRAFDLPARFAGVGLARKMAMDKAAFFFYSQGKTECPILSLDADTLVEPDYTDEVIRIFRSSSLAGVSLAYAHRLEEVGPEVMEAMVKYELYLRYYQLGLEFAGHPHAFHCIGSAFAVRVSDYVAQGGMNKRQAGEDFYFLQKLIATGRYTTLRTTCVYPSARFSERTPFGTGRSLREIVSNHGFYPVYAWEAFRILRTFFSGTDSLYKAGTDSIVNYLKQQDRGLQDFLESIGAKAMIDEANANSASLFQFKRRFFDHFNAFRVLKFLNYLHENRIQKTDISVAVRDLFRETGLPLRDSDLENLLFLRKREYCRTDKCRPLVSD